jgi:uncharacterized protein (DUF4415 family)
MKTAYTNEAGEVRELDAAFFAKAKRGRPSLPVAVRRKRVNLMLDADVIEGLRASGNMSALVNTLLRRHLSR